LIDTERLAGSVPEVGWTTSHGALEFAMKVRLGTPVVSVTVWAAGAVPVNVSVAGEAVTRLELVRFNVTVIF
jgi:hypothetical protein